MPHFCNIWCYRSLITRRICRFLLLLLPSLAASHSVITGSVIWLAQLSEAIVVLTGEAEAAIYSRGGWKQDPMKIIFNLSKIGQRSWLDHQSEPDLDRGPPFDDACSKATIPRIVMCHFLTNGCVWKSLTDNPLHNGSIIVCTMGCCDNISADGGWECSLVCSNYHSDLPSHSWQPFKC